jgi:hypothetical protein
MNEGAVLANIVVGRIDDDRTHWESMQVCTLSFFIDWSSIRKMVENVVIRGLMDVNAIIEGDRGSEVGYDAEWAIR